MESNGRRQKPNILITGTPGVGKSTLCELLEQKLGFEYIHCGKVIAENKYWSEYDEELDTHILDDEKLLDHIEDRMDSLEGGCIVDYHDCDFFPMRWFDYVIVLRCNNTLLYDRLAARGYNAKKIERNIECEIFETLLEEAKQSYDEDIVHEFRNETTEQLFENVDRICEMVKQWEDQ